MGEHGVATRSSVIYREIPGTLGSATISIVNRSETLRSSGSIASHSAERSSVARAESGVNRGRFVRRRKERFRLGARPIG